MTTPECLASYGGASDVRTTECDAQTAELYNALTELIQYHDQITECLWGNPDGCPEPTVSDPDQCVNCRALRAAGYLDDE